MKLGLRAASADGLIACSALDGNADLHHRARVCTAQDQQPAVVLYALLDADDADAIAARAQGYEILRYAFSVVDDRDGNAAVLFFQSNCGFPGGSVAENIGQRFLGNLENCSLHFRAKSRELVWNFQFRFDSAATLKSFGIPTQGRQ